MTPRWSAPQIMSAPFCKNTARPTVTKICAMWLACMTGRMSDRSTRNPIANSAGPTTTHARYGSIPARSWSTQARNMPTIRNSPWAKFAMRTTPKVSVRPTLTSA